MTQQISPAAAGVVVVVLALLIGLIVWRVTGVNSQEGARPPGMPADVASQMQKAMSKAPGVHLPSGAPPAQGGH